jgi:CBS domain-containing protein
MTLVAQKDRIERRDLNMSLEKFCRKPLIKISPDTDITEACHLMEQNNVGSLVAEKDGKLCGIVTDRDIALRVTGARKDPQTTRVKDIMTPDPIRISVDKDIHHLTSLMHAYHVRRVPIVNGFDATLGIVTLDDLIAELGDEMSEIGKAISEEFPRGNA